MCILRRLCAQKKDFVGHWLYACCVGRLPFCSRVSALHGGTSIHVLLDSTAPPKHGLTKPKTSAKLEADRRCGADAAAILSDAALGDGPWVAEHDEDLEAARDAALQLVAAYVGPELGGHVGLGRLVSEPSGRGSAPPPLAKRNHVYFQ